MPRSARDSPAIPSFDDLGDLRLSPAVQMRYRTLEQLRALISSTVSGRRLGCDAGLLGVTAVLSLMTTQTGLAAPSIAGIVLAAAYTVPRLLIALRAATTYAGLADERVVALSASERDLLPPQLHSPIDARSLAELDRVLRPSPALISLRQESRFLVCFQVALIVSAGFVAVTVVTAGDPLLRVAALQILVATMVPHVAASFFAWANQRHIDAVFDQAQRVLAAGGLDRGDLDADAVVRAFPDGSAWIDPSRLHRGLRPRRGTTRRPPALPIVVLATSVVLEALALAAVIALTL